LRGKNSNRGGEKREGPHSDDWRDYDVRVSEIAKEKLGIKLQ